MRLTDLNRDGGIGANCLHVEIGNFRFIFDAGLHPKRVGLPATPDLSAVPAGSTDFIVLTHCHLDHLGALPVVMKHQPQASVLMSIPSKMLAARMLHNSCNVMKRQREELNIEEYPLFQHGDIDRCESGFAPLAFKQTRTLRSHTGGDTIDFTLFPAGHIVGAAGVRLVHKHRKIFFTGDVLFSPQRTLPGADFPDEQVDTLVLETTRGATERQASLEREAELSRLLDTIDATLSRGGSVLIPVFALGRMQEILSVLNDATKKGLIPRVPVICGGLGIDLASYFDEISRRTGLINFRHKILKELKVKSMPEFRAGRPPGERGIYLLSSGMLVGNTPSYACAASLLADTASSICFVGYCDPDTPGGHLLASSPGETFLFDKLEYACPIRARVERFELSGHADRGELLDFAASVEPRAIVLTHGDPEARTWFKEQLAERLPTTTVIDPIPLQTYTV